MRKILFLTFLSAILITTSAFAYSITPGDWVKVNTGVGGSYSGYFSGAINLYETNQTGTSSIFAFQTFCVEFSEHIYVGTPTYVSAIGDAAVSGGPGYGAPSGDPLSGQTKWLYYNFIAGKLEDPGYLSGFSYNNAASYSALQQAIWYFEEEIGSPANSLALSFINQASNKSTSASVQVMNLLSRPGGDRRQDLLILTPEPLSLLLLGLGLIGVAGLRRKIK